MATENTAQYFFFRSSETPCAATSLTASEATPAPPAVITTAEAETCGFVIYM